MSSTNKTPLGLNMWEASDKPMRQDFVNDNSIIDDKITQLNHNLDKVNSNLDKVNSNLSDSDWLSNGSCNYRKKNGYVTVTHKTLLSPTTTLTQVAMLPPEYRPNVSLLFTGVCDLFGRHTMGVTIYDNGEVKIESDASYYYGKFTAIFPV